MSLQSIVHIAGLLLTAISLYALIAYSCYLHMKRDKRLLEALVENSFYKVYGTALLVSVGDLESFSRTNIATYCRAVFLACAFSNWPQRVLRRQIRLTNEELGVAADEIACIIANQIKANAEDRSLIARYMEKSRDASNS